MRQHPLRAAVLLAAGALLLAPSLSSAQVSVGVGRYGMTFGTPYYGYGYSPGYYGYSPYGWGYSPMSTSSYYTPSYSYGTYAYPNYTSSSYYYPSSGYTYGYSSYPSYSMTDLYANGSRSYSYGAPTDTSGYYTTGPASRANERNTVLLNVRLPDPNATVWVEGKQTDQRGTWREFVSPPINPDMKYTYEVRARWMQNGREVERTRRVPVRANAVATVDFTAADDRSRTDEIDRDRRGTDAERSRTDEIDRDRRGTDIDRRGTDIDRRGTDIDRRGTDIDRRGTDVNPNRSGTPQPRTDEINPARPGTGNTRPGTTNPGTTNPRTTNPGTGGTTNPGTGGTTNPGTGGTTNPGTTNPGTTNPGTGTGNSGKP